MIVIAPFPEMETIHTKKSSPRAAVKTIQISVKRLRQLLFDVSSSGKITQDIYQELRDGLRDVEEGVFQAEVAIDNNQLSGIHRSQV